jgi:hypothetical protein
VITPIIGVITFALRLIIGPADRFVAKQAKIGRCDTQLSQNDAILVRHELL